MELHARKRACRQQLWNWGMLLDVSWKSLHEPQSSFEIAFLLVHLEAFGVNRSPSNRYLEESFSLKVPRRNWRLRSMCIESTAWNYRRSPAVFHLLRSGSLWRGRPQEIALTSCNMMLSFPLLLHFLRPSLIYSRRTTRSTILPRNLAFGSSRQQH